MTFEAKTSNVTSTLDPFTQKNSKLQTLVLTSRLPFSISNVLFKLPIVAQTQNFKTRTQQPRVFTRCCSVS